MDYSSQDAVAQVMGYVAAFGKDDTHPPLAVVLTQSQVDCLLFPFVIGLGTGERLLKAAKWTFDLWKPDGCKLDSKSFLILGALINERVRKNMNIVVAQCENW